MGNDFSYHQLLWSCISSRHSRAYPFLRFDDMQHFVLVICNFYEIDDMQGLRLDFIAKNIGLQG